MSNKKRHQCSKCQSKIYEKKMYKYYYPLLNRTAWHCEKCVESEKWGITTIVSRPALGNKSKMSS